MSAHPCCALKSRAASGTTRAAASSGRRGRELAGWILSGAALALIPKCPACLAAYVALATGVGLSASSAAHLRMGLLAACLGSLGYLASRRIRRWLPRARRLAV